MMSHPVQISDDLRKCQCKKELDIEYNKETRHELLNPQDGCAKIRRLPTAAQVAALLRDDADWEQPASADNRCKVVPVQSTAPA